MKQGIDCRVRLNTASSLIGLFIVAMFVAACAGGGSVPGQGRQFSQENTNCIGNPNTQATTPAITQVGTCPSPPPQWDIIVDNPGNNTATSYQFTTTGNATPLATLAPANQLNGDYGIWFDGDTGDFFISNSNANTVTRYGLGCLNGGSHTGMACPDQTLSGSLTGLNAPYGATENYKLMLPQGDEPAYTINVPTSGSASIVAQLENQAGNATPLYTIKGTNTQLSDGKGLGVDSSGGANQGAIYADSVSGKQVMMWLPSSQFPNPTPNQVINIKPYKVIGGTLTGITDPVGLYVDLSGYLYVCNQNTNQVLVFTPTANGNVSPVNIISTSLSSPYGVSVYTDLTVWVTNDGDNSLREYTNGEGPKGSSALKDTIMGANTGLNKPANLDVRISR